MKAYNRCHPPRLRARTRVAKLSQWLSFWAELQEFIAEPSSEEAWDVLHFGRFVWKLTGIPLHGIAYLTVKKHGQRFAMTGCIRSTRNCEKQCLNHCRSL